MRMDEQIVNEINRLKEEIYNRKEKVSEIGQLVKREIDRDFPINLWELSERELDNEMGTRLSILNDDIDIRPDPRALTSHRRILGKPLVFIKRLFMKVVGFYTDTLLEKQWHFNERLVAFHLASFIRFRSNEQKIKALEEKLKTFEEEYEMMLEQLEKLKNERDKPGND
jgi:hypothetical protein